MDASVKSGFDFAVAAADADVGGFSGLPAVPGNWTARLSPDGSYVMTGGSFTINNGVFVGYTGTGTLDVSGAAVMTVNGNVNIGGNANGIGILKLHNGGKIVANHFKKHQGTASLVQFDGGTLRAHQTDDILKNLANVELKAGGGKIDELLAALSRFLVLALCVFSGFTAFASEDGHVNAASAAPVE